MNPTAEIHVRQAVPHRSAGPAICHSKRMGAGAASSLVARRSLAKAAMQLDANPKTPMRNRITLPSFSPFLIREAAYTRINAHWRKTFHPTEGAPHATLV
jgi:hypothetical protein